MKILGDDTIRAIDITKYFNEESQTLDFMRYGKAIAQEAQKDTLRQVTERLDTLCEFRHEQCQFVINDFGKWTKWMEELKEQAG